MATAIMQAMEIEAPGRPLRAITRRLPVPGRFEILLAVHACGVCRTDLHILDGDIPARHPIIPGHEIVGRVVAVGPGVSGVHAGQRLGVPWLGSTCGQCRFCLGGQENLCDSPEFTGCTRDGGYATHVVADARYCFAIPACFSDVDAAPLLCAGLIGWRALRLAGDGRTIGLYGFGAAAHLIAQVAIWQGRTVYAFTRPGDDRAQEFARALGCAWAGASDTAPPALIDAALLFAPVGALIPQALTAVRKGGQVVCAGIHMSDIPSFPYAELWGERHIRSVANLTRADGISFLSVAARAGIRTFAQPYPLDQAAAALDDLRAGKLNGAAVLVPALGTQPS